MRTARAKMQRALKYRYFLALYGRLHLSQFKSKIRKSRKVGLGAFRIRAPLLEGLIRNRLQGGRRKAETILEGDVSIKL